MGPIGAAGAAPAVLGGTANGPDTAAAEEAALVERARAGDREAFGALVERHQQALGVYLRHLTGDAEAARNLTQDAFVRAWCAIGRTRAGLALRPWLFRIATNLARDHLRRRRRFWWLPLEVVDRVVRVDDAETAVERDAVRRALARRRPDERAVLLLCGLERLPYEQAAAALGASAEAVRKRFARAKERFRRVYSETAGSRVPGAAGGIGP